MAQKIILEVDVIDGELVVLKNNLDETNQSFEQVGDTGKKATEKYSGAIKKSNPIVEELNKKTGGLLNTVIDLDEGVKKANISFKGMKTALIASGIGAFVVIVGTLVAYWGDIKDFVSGTNRELERQAKYYDDLSKKQEHALDLLNNSDEILKEQGKTQTEINALKQEEINKLIEIQKKELELAKVRLQNLQDIREGGGKGLEAFFRVGQTLLTNFANFIDETLARFGIKTNFAESAFTSGSSVIEQIFGSKEDIEAQKKKIQELESSIQSLSNTAAGLRNQNKTNGQVGSVGEVEGFSITTQLLYDLGQVRLANEIDLQKAISEAQEAESRYRISLAQAEADAKLEAAYFYANQLSAVAQIVGKESAAGKAFAVAAALASTYLSAQKAYESQFQPLALVDSPIRAALAAGVAVASGLANVKKIMSIKMPGGGGAGATPSIGGGLGGANIAAPSFNVVGNAGINQIGEAIGDQTDKPAKAYIVYDDIKKASDLEKNTVESATI